MLLSGAGGCCQQISQVDAVALLLHLLGLVQALFDWQFMLVRGEPGVHVHVTYPVAQSGAEH